ncbi:MAG: zinc ABC transporter substrate-binding protein [Candidatus Omnitrophica bacterium]|nr:zinc ABC transporter substrate-binding protein [Candidatus Omnitrophota bacterium]
MVRIVIRFSKMMTASAVSVPGTLRDRFLFTPRSQNLSLPRSPQASRPACPPKGGQAGRPYLVPWFLLFLLSGLVLFHPNLFAAGKIKIVATTPVIASLVREVVQDTAEVYAVSSPKRDIHFYAPTPKDVLKVKKADVFVHTGLDLEAWRPPLVEAAGNGKFLGSGKTAIDMSQGISLLEIPQSLSRSQGDIHIYGNPHYWTDPENAKIMVQNIVHGLAKLYPNQEALFLNYAEEFNKRIDVKMKEWNSKMAPYKGQPIVTYHKSWPYFAKRFGLDIAGYLEPIPGIPPTAKHIAELIKLMKEKQVKVIVREAFHETRTPAKAARETGATVVTLLQNVGAAEGVEDYFSMTDYNVNQLVQALNH